MNVSNSVLNAAISLMDNEVDIFHHDQDKSWIKSKPGSTYPEIEADLFSRRSISWLTWALHTKTGVLLSERNVKRICHFIEGSKKNRHVSTGSDLSLSNLVEEPIIATFLSWSEKVMAFPYQKQFADWFSELHRHSKGGQFPRSPSSLSRKIKPLLAGIRALGFDITLSRTAKGVSVRIKKMQEYECLHSGGTQHVGCKKTWGQAEDDDNAVIQQLLNSRSEIQ